MADQANMKADLWELTIGGNAAPHHVAIELSGAYTLFYPKSGRTGDDEYPPIVTGRNITITVRFVEWTKAEIKRFLNLPAADAVQLAQAVGDRVSTQAVELHDPLATDNWGDIIIPAAVFSDLQRSHDGQGAAEYAVQIRGTRDANGEVWKIGKAAA